MNKGKYIKIFLQITLYLALLGLFIKSYLIEQITDFVAKRKTITSRFEKVTELEFPTITICLDPPQKSSVAKKFGFEKQVEIHLINTTKLNTTFIGMVNEMSYNLNQDFYIEIEGKVQMLEENEWFIVERIMTWYHGICYKLEPTFIINPSTVPIWFLLKVYLSKGLSQEDKPTQFIIYLTSNYSWTNILQDFWPRFEPTKLYFNFENQPYRKELQIRAINHIFMEGIFDSKTCILQSFNDSNCKSANELDIKFIPICNSSFEFYDFPPSCLSRKVEFEYETQLNAEKLYNADDQEVAFWIDQKTLDIKIMEEVNVITLADLIGSVGGSLGMFFGFSTSGCLLSLAKRMFDRYGNI